MANSIEMASIDDQILWIPQTEKDEIEGSKVDHSNNINQIFAKKFKDLDNSSIKSCTIFKANVWQRESNPDAYTPKMVSIGPYHKKNPQLHQMEKYKLVYLQRFLQRKEGLDVESCLNELEELKERAIKCYEDVEDLGNNGQFRQMLLLDGCFVVEFIREYSRIYAKEAGNIINTNGCYVFRDLMLLENQLPFFVLNKLHLMTKRDDELPLAILGNDLFTRFVYPKMTHASSLRTECNEGNIKHLLHVLHIFSCHGNKSKDDKEKHMVMPNATELSQAGVSFLKEDTRGCYNVLLHLGCNSKKKQEVKEVKFEGNISLFDIKFENGSMTIPCFQVTDGTETILRNLIAYEQQSYDVQPKYFSDLLAFMDYLIESDKDVNLLRQKGIIQNLIGDDKEVASIFKKMGAGVTIYGDFYYKEECRKAAEHCKKPWNNMKANLLRNYFSSPWVGASTVAAIVLLILTFIQTILAIIDLFNK